MWNETGESRTLEHNADWEHLPGRLIVVSGPSGVGKSTVLRRVLAMPDLRVRMSVSATTRPLRAGERDGLDYRFVSRESFLQSIARDAFLEWAEVHGNYYGTPAEPVREWMGQGYCVLLDIDVQGGRQVVERVPGALLVWIEPPSLESLEARLRGRGTEDETTLRRRLAAAQREIEAAARFYPRELMLTNRDGEEGQAADRLAALLRNHGCQGAHGDAG